jgi:hypothetical protein
MAFGFSVVLPKQYVICYLAVVVYEHNTAPICITISFD